MPLAVYHGACAASQTVWSQAPRRRGAITHVRMPGEGDPPGEVARRDAAHPLRYRGVRLAEPFQT